MTRTSKLLLSAYYFISVAFYVFPTAYLPLYFKDLGLNAWEVAILSSGAAVSTIFSPIIAQYLSHSFIGTRKLIALNSVLTVISCICFALSKSFYPLLISNYLMFFFKNCADNLVDTELLKIPLERKFSFEKIRIWGSVGYTVANFLLGNLLDQFSTQIIPTLCAILLMVLLFNNYSILNLFPDTISNLEHEEKNLRLTKKSIFPYISLIAITMLVWASHGPYYVYYSIYLQELKWSTKSISLAWNIGVIAEILFFLLVPKFTDKKSYLIMLFISTILTSLRWFIIGLTTNTSLLYATQVLHAFSFTGCYISANKLCFLILPKKHSAKGYGVFVAIGIGIGSILGRVISGKAASELTGYLELNSLFTYASFSLFFSLPFFYFLLDRQKQNK
jgi:MFS transporter, PPP family, 3-phenylpropionic acid transporter